MKRKFSIYPVVLMLIFRIKPGNRQYLLILLTFAPFTDLRAGYEQQQPLNPYFLLPQHFLRSGGSINKKPPNWG
ncbi:MAG TPA: hypothetical protein VIQ31_04955 [Phormidium sp.]